MAPPSQLSIATSSVMRLIKEESSYHKELQQQETRLETLKKEGGDENFEYTMKQQEKAIRETRAIFPELKEKIMQAVASLELQLDTVEQGSIGSDPGEVTKAKGVLSQAMDGQKTAA